ncbi:MAG: GIY-YIG nuclease family protein [Patescibacteria group bacterium]
MKIDDFKKIKLPDAPGVYLFKKGDDILYIGKATFLTDRVKSYFSADLIKTRGMLLVDMVAKAETIEYQETGSVLEALLLETELIKQHKPHYNTKEKDDKSYSYVVITKEEYPTIYMLRGRNLERQDKNHYSHMFGPFTSGVQLREALHIIRKIFPYKDEKCVANSGKMCFNASIGLCPGVCVGKISAAEYKKEVKKIVLFLGGKTKQVTALLKKEMNAHAKALHFEKAEVIKKQIYALEHIRDVSLIKQESIKPKVEGKTGETRIEAYDIAHMQGTNMVGVMVVMIDGELTPSEYKKFIIKSVKSSNDPAALREVLLRRFGHPEWGMPNIVVVDGNDVQKNVAREIVTDTSIRILSVVKDNRHKAKDILGELPKTASPEEIYKINAEAHRFAIAYFRRKQRKNALL